MIKDVKKRAVLFLATGICAGLLGGCGRGLTPGKIMNRVNHNLTNVESFASHVDVDIKMEDVVHYTKVTMDMDLESTMDPKAGHAKGTAEVSVRGVNLTSQLEIYQLEEGESTTTYSGMDGTWTKETGAGGSGISLDKSLFSELESSIDGFRLAEERITLEDQVCYEMYGTVSGEELIGVLGSQMLHSFGLVELPDDSMVAELQIPVTFDVYEKEMLPARMIVDMTEVMNDLYDSLGETTDVTHYMIVLSFSEYDSVNEIVVPQEVQESAQSVAAETE